ncbi:hypothetical protein VOLCADRAFT_106876 [Volvox carteri f. nagariensis]|uniref:DM2 domain-containing protein n=1 Tax=Volvox carteri f. nagariensis TaxID=3068 RepID=D8UAD9_VOLCA|nr:uncharacterized protein VOLCADRAFT_106876 [Volvox carteri f. nagariensis]EFJ43298.1 hypothetical protein VOLCADRAFT_106876 [Volvox carteri f. nagariensis]|eukprot:XP_002955658.1 hypothetical protein VOLCADRAFT_106876 [Volvox carteri f. nagariensis]
MSVTDEQLIVRLRALLGESDLQTTTEKMLRKKLEEEFKIDLTDKKLIIRNEIEKYLEEQAGSDEDEHEDGSGDGDDSTPARGSSLGCLLSEPLQKFLGEESLPRTQVVKRLWDYIKANNLQDPKDRRRILLDDKLRTLFTAPLTMFSINSQLSRHCKTLDAEEPRPRAAKSSGDKRPSSDKPKSGSDKPKAKKAKTGDGEGGDAGERKNNNFNKPLRLSKDLASWCGADTMGRSDLTKFFWAYVKEHKLQDPSNKQYILCDAHLKKVTGESRIQAFAIQKYLAGHIIKD